MNEKCNLCICFAEFFFFYWLLVVSLVILIAVPFVFSPPFNRLQEYSKCRAYQALLRLHIDKTIEWKINIIISLLCWSLTLVCSFKHSLQLALQKWEPADRICGFRNFLNGLAKSPRVLRSSWILNECNFCCKIVKYWILSEVCMIKTVPHSTVSPQMWCINGIKGWFTRNQICWQDFVK